MLSEVTDGPQLSEPVAGVGPRLRAQLVALAMLVVASLVGVTWLVAAGSSGPVGRLAYGDAGLSFSATYVAGSPFSVETPPLVDLGRAPLRLEKVALVTTGCQPSLDSTSFFHFRGAGISNGPNITPRAQWASVWHLVDRAGAPRGTVLRPGTEWSPSYVEVFTLSVPHSSAVLIAGFLATYETGGATHTQFLRERQVFLPRRRGESSTAADVRRGQRLLNSLRVSAQGAPSSVSCEVIRT